MGLEKYSLEEVFEGLVGVLGVFYIWNSRW